MQASVGKVMTGMASLGPVRTC